MNFSISGQNGCRVGFLDIPHAGEHVWQWMCLVLGEQGDIFRSMVTGVLLRQADRVGVKGKETQLGCELEEDAHESSNPSSL